MALYQLTMFYQNIQNHAATVQNLKSDIETVAGKNWRVLNAGEQVCAIGFESDLANEAIREQFSRYDGIENFYFLIVEASDVVVGVLTEDIWRWLGVKSVQ